MEKYETTCRPDEIDDMCKALASIADEIERFQISEKAAVGSLKTCKENSYKNSNFNYKYKLKFNSKKQIIAKLRKDLKSACYVAKSLMSLNNKETTALTSQLVYARGECVDLLERYNNNIDIIANLHKRNTNLHEKLISLSKFIHLGYEELIKIQSEKTDKPSTLAQLKKIIESCGQYYADYIYENKMNLQIKQRNRFLKNKIIILENNIEAIKEQLKALEYRNMKLKTQNDQIKARSLLSKTLNLKVAYSEVKMKKSIEEFESSTDERRYQESGDSLQEQGKCFGLSTHLEIVKQLLSDQDTLLKDLSLISRNFICLTE